MTISRNASPAVTRGRAPAIHSLELFGRIAEGRHNDHVESFRPFVTGYQRSQRLFGGPWQAKWEIRGDDEAGRPFNADYAREWAYSRLGYHIEERVARMTLWAGMVIEVDLFIGGWGERHSLIPVRNHIRVRYIDTNGESQVTSWVDDQPSIDTYGQRDDEITLEKDSATQAEAENHRDAELARLAVPQIEPLAVDEGADDHAIVRASGYVFTAQYRYHVQPAGEVAIPTLLTNLANDDMQFIRPGSIDSSVSETTQVEGALTRAWDAIKAVIGRRANTEEPPYIAQVSHDRYLHYQQISATPNYAWRGRSIEHLSAGQGGVDPWMVVPGILRNANGRRLTPPPGSWLEDGRDILMAEVTMADGLEQPIITPTGSTEAELRKAFRVRGV